MSKLIIKNRTELCDYSIILLIKSVIEKGKISNSGTQYCYVCTFTLTGIGSKDEIVVYSSKTKTGTHTFEVDYV